ncbi:MAG: hypothetical protein WCT99_05100 [Bacteroidota bacterium]|jgi:hypothetical protein
MNNKQQCLACEQTQEHVPLMTIVFQNNTFYICPQHLPVLIHNPQLLAGKLPGAEGMSPADHQD